MRYDYQFIILRLVYHIDRLHGLLVFGLLGCINDGCVFLSVCSKICVGVVIDVIFDYMLCGLVVAVIIESIILHFTIIFLSIIYIFI